MQLVKQVLKNSRVMDCIQAAEMLWGRDTLFDDYTKLTTLVNKCRSPDDLAFIVELIFVRMKQSVQDNGGLPKIQPEHLCRTKPVTSLAHRRRGMPSNGSRNSEQQPGLHTCRLSTNCAGH